MRYLSTFALFAFLTGCNCGSPSVVTTARIAIEPESLVFADTVLGETRLADLTITNQSARDISIKSVTLAGPAAFQLKNDLTGTAIAPNAAVKLTIGFSPNAEGNHAAELLISHDAESRENRIPFFGVAKPKLEEPPNPCAKTSCDAIPESACIADGKAARVYSTPGRCQEDGGCLFAFEDVPCSDGCDATRGRCQGCVSTTCVRAGRKCGKLSDGCGATLDCGDCTTPPAATCTNGKTLRTFSASGECSDGACSYVSTDTVCSFRCDPQTSTCENCTPQSCASLRRECGPAPDGCGVTLQCGGCDSPPRAICADEKTRRSFAKGVCSAQGTCSYSAADDFCPSGCDAARGECKTCTPSTCAQLGKNCGSVPNGCGVSLNCGTCPAGQTCGPNNVCVQASCAHSCRTWTDCTAPGEGCDLSRGCCVPCGRAGGPCCVDFANGRFLCNSAADVCGRSQGSGGAVAYYCCADQGDGCCSAGGCSGGTCCKCPRNGLNACVQPSFGCGGC